MKMKLIIVGGEFEVSVEALKRLIAGGSEAVVTLNKEKFSESDVSIKTNFEKSVDVGDGYKQLNMDGFIKKFLAIYRDEDSYMFMAKLVRRCPIFIRIVEEMGREAGGPGCTLRVVEVPDNIPECVDLDPNDAEPEEQRECWLLQDDDEGNECVMIRKVELCGSVIENEKVSRRY
jgi:hypothetical protein